MISIVGLAIVQYQYLRIGLNLARVQFNVKIEKTGDDIKEGLKLENKLTFLIVSSFEEDTSYFTISVDSLQKASSYFLDDFIKEQLVNNSIDSDFSFNLYSKDSVYYLRSPLKFSENDEVQSYPMELTGYFPEHLGKPIFLELQFKNLPNYFLGKLNGLTLPSMLFLIGICVTVIWVLRTYYWQSNIITTTNEFINNLTHELKTPVFSIGLATKILEGSAHDKQKPVLNIVSQQVKRLSNHIDKVLELGSLESGKHIIKLEKVDFRPFLENICAEFKTLVSIENGAFLYDLQQGEYNIKAEVFHLENAIINILDNAKKYSDDPKISLNAKMDKSKLFIEITDNGRGISPENLEKIFKKYYRVVDGDLHTVNGYGLGLSYVKKVIEKHNGKVLIESMQNVGSKVIVIIPTST
ncbi:sensor histidine kinase [Maribacter sp. CXY002]|uniref:sensor histidine kinase n=1 Tax=Maribacter luteocoastalis TaxID=3407671 RepID=UPI003B6737B0